jgi:hypothetical protein
MEMARKAVVKQEPRNPVINQKFGKTVRTLPPDLKKMTKEELRVELLWLRENAKENPKNALGNMKRARQICREIIERIEIFMDTIEEWRS